MIGPIRRAGLVVVVIVAAAVALLVAACGGSGARTSSTSKPKRPPAVVFYSSLPRSGPQAAQGRELVNGIVLALAQAHYQAGDFKIDYGKGDRLDDSSRRGLGWSATRTADNARTAATDPRAMYYIGELESAASEISIPILNEAGIAQISPTNTYVGLTEAIGHVTASGEPERYYPTGNRTFLRLVPPDTVQAAADLLALKDFGCGQLAVADDGGTYANGFATLLADEGKDYQVAVVSITRLAPGSLAYRDYPATIKSQGAQCFEYVGTPNKSAVALAEAVHAELPRAPIVGPSSMCTSAWTDPDRGGVAPDVAPLLMCTRPTLAVRAYPGGKSFIAAYRSRYHGASPGPDAILGYEAAELGIETVAELGPNGDNRADFVRRLFEASERDSVLGNFGFNANGDTTLNAYGLYGVGVHGDPVYLRTLVPTKYLTTG